MTLINKIMLRELHDGPHKVFEIGSRDASDAFFLCTLNKNLQITCFDGHHSFIRLAKPFKEMCDRLEVVENVISESTEKIEFFHTETQDEYKSSLRGVGASSILEPKIGLRDIPVTNYSVYQVTSQTGKSAVATYGQPSAIIMDVQGSEMTVLRSFEDTIRDVQCIFTEVNLKKNTVYEGDEGAIAVITYLEKFGFYLQLSYQISQYSADLIFTRRSTWPRHQWMILKLVTISFLKFRIKSLLNILKNL